MSMPSWSAFLALRYLIWPVMVFVCIGWTSARADDQAIDNDNVSTEISAGKPCREDKKRFCADVERGGGKTHECLLAHVQELTAACLARVREKNRAQGEPAIDSSSTVAKASGGPLLVHKKFSPTFTLRDSAPKPIYNGWDLSHEFEQILQKHPASLAQARGADNMRKVALAGIAMVTLGALLELKETLDEAETLNNDRLPEKRSNAGFGLVILGGAIGIPAALVAKSRFNSAVDTYNQNERLAAASSILIGPGRHTHPIGYSLLLQPASYHGHETRMAVGVNLRIHF